MGNPGAGAGNGNGNPGGNGKGLGGQPATAERIYTDEISDYGVCRGTDPVCYNDWGQGWAEGKTKRVLIWSRTAGPRHAHLGTALGPGLNPPLAANNVAQRAMVDWLAERGIQADYTEDLSRFSLNNYQAVIFLSSNRDTMDDTAQTTLKQFIRRGGGFVGIHNAFGAEYSYPWYEGLLGGANFYDHGPHRDGTIETVNGADVSTEFLPEEWQYRDEWYNLVPYPSYVNVLLEVDEETSVTNRATGHPGHAALGEAHPVSWCHYYDGGRSWLTTLGHDPANFTDAEFEGGDFFKEHVLAGVESAMGITPFCES
ncbi:ThuA domain-containing protein [Aquipuribacter nitratireducens]|uniref:ThuA domain-containing protein n=1 Tax=Aquipuribacter nitratireducens TaxID=650104 RepID=A0ABW0GQZ5_9MICO